MGALKKTKNDTLADPRFREKQFKGAKVKNNPSLSFIPHAVASSHRLRRMKDKSAHLELRGFLFSAENSPCGTCVRVAFSTTSRASSLSLAEPALIRLKIKKKKYRRRERETAVQSRHHRGCSPCESERVMYYQDFFLRESIQT